MADDLIRDLISRLPAQAVLPATLLAAGLSLADKIPKLLEGLGPWRAKSKLKRELEIYKLRYEIAALKKQHGLQDLGEHGMLLKADSMTSVPLNARERFLLGASGSALAWITVITLLPARIPLMDWQDPWILLTWGILLLGIALGGASSALVRFPRQRRLVCMSIGAAAVAVVSLFIFVWAWIYFTYYWTPPCGKDC